MNCIQVLNNKYVCTIHNVFVTSFSLMRNTPQNVKLQFFGRPRSEESVLCTTISILHPWLMSNIDLKRATSKTVNSCLSASALFSFPFKQFFWKSPRKYKFQFPVKRRRHFGQAVKAGRFGSEGRVFDSQLIPIFFYSFLIASRTTTLCLVN